MLQWYIRPSTVSRLPEGLKFFARVWKDIYLDGIFKTMLKHQRLQCKSWFLTAKPCKTFELQTGGHRTGKTGWNCGDTKENNAMHEKKLQCKEKSAMPVKLFLQTLASVNIPGPCALRPDTSLYDMLEDLNILLLAGPSIWQFDIGLAFYMNGDSLDCVVTWLKNTSDHSAQKCC